MQALARGVKVEIITAARRDQPAYKNMKNSLLMKRLLLRGVAAWEYLPGVLHSKCYFIDGKIVNLGSFNNDRWSWRINDEVNVRIEDPELYQKLMADALLIKKQCNRVTLLKGN